MNTYKLQYAAEKNLENINNILNKSYGLMIISGENHKDTVLILNDLIANNIKNIDSLILCAMNKPNVNDNFNIKNVFLKNDLPSIMHFDADLIFSFNNEEPDNIQKIIELTESGHQLIKTLETDNLFNIIRKLNSLGLENKFLDINGFFAGAIQTKLIKKLCNNCSLIFKDEHNTFKHKYKGEGCSDCEHTGYDGYLVLTEILDYDKDLLNLIFENKTEEAFQHFNKNLKTLTISEQLEESINNGLIDPHDI